MEEGKPLPQGFSLSGDFAPVDTWQRVDTFLVVPGGAGGT